MPGFATSFESMDLSVLPLANPGNWLPWNNAGFLSVGDVAPPAADDEVVHIAGPETITGLKGFTAGLTIGASLWKLIDNGGGLDIRDSSGNAIAQFPASGSGGSYIKGGYFGLGGASASPSVMLDVASTTGTLKVLNGLGTADAPITASRGYFSNDAFFTNGIRTDIWNSLDNSKNVFQYIGNNLRVLQNDTAPLIQLCGTTSAYPAIKRNGTAINFRLADDSAYAPIEASTVTAQSATGRVGGTIDGSFGYSLWTLSAGANQVRIGSLAGGEHWAQLGYGGVAFYSDTGVTIQNKAGTADAPITASNVTASGNISLTTAGTTILGVSGGALHVGCLNGGTFLGDSAVYGGDAHVGSLGVRLRRTRAFAWSSDDTSYGAIDAKLTRYATGPAVEVNAAGGLRVRDLLGTADAPITAGAATFSGDLTLTNGNIRTVSGGWVTMLGGTTTLFGARGAGYDAVVFNNLRLGFENGDSGVGDTYIGRHAAGALGVYSERTGAGNTLGDLYAKAATFSGDFQTGNAATAACTIKTITDPINPSVSAIEIGATTTSTRLFLGAAGKPFYSLNLSNVSSLENVPSILVTDGLSIGNPNAGIGITREAYTDAMVFTGGTPNAGGYKWYGGPTYSGYTVDQTLIMELSKAGALTLTNALTIPTGVDHMTGDGKKRWYFDGSGASYNYSGNSGSSNVAHIWRDALGTNLMYVLDNGDFVVNGDGVVGGQLTAQKLSSGLYAANEFYAGPEGVTINANAGMGTYPLVVQSNSTLLSRIHYTGAWQHNGNLGLGASPTGHSGYGSGRVLHVYDITYNLPHIRLQSSSVEGLFGLDGSGIHLETTGGGVGFKAGGVDGRFVADTDKLIFQIYDSTLAAWQETERHEASASGGKWGIFGKSALQQTGGVMTAGAAYTANEQDMIQKSYNALRTFGLLD